MGALGMAQKLAATPALAAFTGAMVAGSLGMTVGYQLPVFLAAVRKDEIGELMRGFIFESGLPYRLVWRSEVRCWVCLSVSSF